MDDHDRNTQELLALAAATTPPEESPGDADENRGARRGSSGKGKRAGTLEEDGNEIRLTRKTYSILLSGMHKAERARYTTAIKRKIKESKQIQDCDMRPSIDLITEAEADTAVATHVVFEFPLRGFKFLVGCCRGSWLLSSSWLSAQTRERVGGGGGSKIFADEEAHEIKGNGEKGTISACCAKFWRTRKERLGGGKTNSVFGGLRVTFWGKIDDKKMLTVLLNEGGATVVPTYSFSRAMTDGHDENFNAEENPVDVVIVPQDKHARQPALETLANYLKENQQAVFAAVSQEFIIDWIARPDMSIRDHVLLTKEATEGVHEYLYEDIDGNFLPRQLVEKANLCRDCTF